MSENIKFNVNIECEIIKEKGEIEIDYKEVMDYIKDDIECSIVENNHTSEFNEIQRVSTWKYAVYRDPVTLKRFPKAAIATVIFGPVTIAENQ